MNAFSLVYEFLNLDRHAKKAFGFIAVVAKRSSAKPTFADIRDSVICQDVTSVVAPHYFENNLRSNKIFQDRPGFWKSNEKKRTRRIDIFLVRLQIMVKYRPYLIQR
jgi:hypothetical protein